MGYGNFLDRRKQRAFRYIRFRLCQKVSGKRFNERTINEVASIITDCFHRMYKKGWTTEEEYENQKEIGFA